MAIRAILFDLGDTLFGLAEQPEDIPARVARALEGALAPADAVALADRIVEAARAFYTTGGRETSFAEADLAALTTEVAGAHGILLDPSAPAAVAAAFGEADISRFRPTPDCGDRVARLRAAGYRLAAVSNTTTTPAMLSAYLERVGLLPSFDAIVYSSAVGVRKPHPDIYHHALRALAVPAAEAIFVGDRVREDVVAPQSLGMSAALTHEFRQEDPGAARPLAVLQRLTDLEALLPSLV